MCVFSKKLSNTCKNIHVMYKGSALPGGCEVKTCRLEYMSTKVHLFQRYLQGKNKAIALSTLSKK